MVHWHSHFCVYTAHCNSTFHTATSYLKMNPKWQWINIQGFERSFYESAVLLFLHKSSLVLYNSCKNATTDKLFYFHCYKDAVYCKRTYRPASSVRGHVTVDLETCRVVKRKHGVDAILSLTTGVQISAVTWARAWDEDKNKKRLKTWFKSVGINQCWRWIS